MHLVFTLGELHARYIAAMEALVGAEEEHTAALKAHIAIEKQGSPRSLADRPDMDRLVKAEELRVQAEVRVREAAYQLSIGLQKEQK